MTITLTKSFTHSWAAARQNKTKWHVHPAKTQPGHLCILIRALAVHWTQSFFMRTAKTLIRLGKWVILLVLSGHGPVSYVLYRFLLLPIVNVWREKKSLVISSWHFSITIQKANTSAPKNLVGLSRVGKKSLFLFFPLITAPNICDLFWVYMGQVMRKCVLIHMRTTKVQFSLRICAVWSAPLLFTA